MRPLRITTMRSDIASAKQYLPVSGQMMSELDHLL
jgi:hypothetical protein